MAEALSLKSLLVPTKSLEVEYPGMEGFVINVAFLSREALVNIRKKATKQTYKNRQPTDELDDELFLKLYVNGCIKGWRGLKLSYLNQLAPVELDAGVDLNTELPYDQENALYLMKSSANFDAFISETVTDLSNFTKDNKKS
ncbi:MAG TPA: hypothetical protein V6C58_23470 [Allocoleopsis sp.]